MFKKIRAKVTPEQRVAADQGMTPYTVGHLHREHNLSRLRTIAILAHYGHKVPAILAKMKEAGISMPRYSKSITWTKRLVSRYKIIPLSEK